MACFAWNRSHAACRFIQNSGVAEVSVGLGLAQVALTALARQYLLRLKAKPTPFYRGRLRSTTVVRRFADLDQHLRE
jgi:hypothetical protein